MERHAMRKIREVLRLKYESGLSHRSISASTGMSKGSVSDYLRRAVEAGLTWEIAQGLDDAELEQLLFRDVGRNLPPARAPIDFEWIHRELPRHGVTLLLLWNEYVAAVAGSESGERPYGYSQFCELYARFAERVDLVMRQIHRAGEKAFIDYSGKRPVIWDRETGEAIEVELYVAVLGASNYTYAEASRSQGLGDFVMSTIRALEYFGAAPEILVPDQLRSAVSGPDRYDPDLNPTYAEMAAHYGTVVIPARPRRPRDKAKVENGVQLAQRWILACLRHRRFYSLDELNEAIAELVERLNTRPFVKLEGTRRSRFESIERPAMKPLPAERYVLARWKKAKVGPDYHLEYDDRYYSVPCSLVGQRVQLRATATTIEILHGDRRVAAHARSYGPKGTVVTDPSHRPRSHQEYGEWPPSRMIAWGESLGPSVAEVVRRILASRPHPEQGYRSCFGLFRELKGIEPARADAACRRALEIGSPTRKSVKAILRRGLDRVDIRPPPPRPRLVHENLRGGEYYDQKEMEKNHERESETHEAHVCPEGHV
jgi:transposase